MNTTNWQGTCTYHGMRARTEGTLHAVTEKVNEWLNFFAWAGAKITDLPRTEGRQWHVKQGRTSGTVSLIPMPEGEGP